MRLHRAGILRVEGVSMNYDQIVDMLERNQSSANWRRVDDENFDGGNSSYCLEDVLLVIRFKLVWRASKPFLSYQFCYGSTILGWFELPTANVGVEPPMEDIVGRARALLVD
jgi:hypothetical protein